MRTSSRRIRKKLPASKLLSITIGFVLCLFFTGGKKTFAQKSSKAFEQIEQILYQQQEDWNNGSIDAFMDAYWNSEELQFGGATGITRGWQQTREGYKIRYPDRSTMGKLTFRIKDITKHSRKVVSLTGSWELERVDDRPGGHFLLIWRKIKGEWKIVVDHTSQEG